MFEVRRTQWLGTVLLEPRLSTRIATTVAVTTAVVLIAVLILASYTRSERISGWLVPEKGVVRILSPQSGLVQSLAVKEGDKVSKGDPLVVLSAELQTEAVGATGEEVLRQLRARRASLDEQQQLQSRIFKQQADELTARVAALSQEQKLLEGEVDAQRRRVQLSRESLARAQYLRERGIVTKASLSAAEGENLDQAARLQALQRSLSQLQRESSAAEIELRELPYQESIKLGDVQGQSATVAQAIAEAEARRQFVIQAPQDGVVTAIQIEVGGSASSSVPLMTIVPTGSALQAQFFAPSRAIGFIRPDQDVLLRYQPFPFQNFGFYKGKVANVSQSAISPSELPQQLTGLATAYGDTAPLYRITGR